MNVIYINDNVNDLIIGYCLICSKTYLNRSISYKKKLVIKLLILATIYEVTQDLCILIYFHRGFIYLLNEKYALVIARFRVQYFLILCRLICKIFMCRLEICKILMCRLKSKM